MIRDEMNEETLDADAVDPSYRNDILSLVGNNSDLNDEPTEPPDGYDDDDEIKELELGEQ